MREHKGKSIVDFLSDYTVIDIETTGLSPAYDSIIELAAIRIRNNVPVFTFQTLVKPPFPVNGLIEALTGITNEMLKNAPTIDEVIGLFQRFIGSDVVVGHNVGFDVNFIYDACMEHLGVPFTNNHINTVRFANKLLPADVRKGLESVCQYMGIPCGGAHRAERDCELANAVYQKLSGAVTDRAAFLDMFKEHRHGSHRKLDIKSILADPNYVPDENSEIFGKAFCFTGALDRMLRKDACQIVVNMGGTLTSGVTKKTDYLVLGCTDYCKTIKDGKTAKQKKANQLQKDGYNILVITEDVFYQMIEDY